ncbi:acyltransferase [Neobacillus pocheonensis]|uniref:Acyltransferase n=1 Tax=Neobacillus pocheonensis TaxID=363869 RepID=A0ABT0WHZ0_9BACI|nr:acyltransferase [Neobacillus pocheonensis]
MAKDKQKLLLVQSLRGIAALIVLIHHGAGIGKKYLNYEYLNNIFSAGWLGVDFFFVLSGFIIYYVHHKDIGQKQRLKQFYLKRFLRVYPIYWIMTIVLVTLFFLVPSWGIGYETKLNVIIKSILLLPQSHDPIVNVGWSLVYEVFFYAVFGSLFY